jgi:hypothetical protein
VFLTFSKKEQLASGFSEYIKLVLKKMCFALTACVPLACAGTFAHRGVVCMLLIWNQTYSFDVAQMAIHSGFVDTQAKIV